MIVIRVELEIKPQDTAGFLRFMESSVQISRSFEGCRKYQIYQEAGSDTRYLLYEEWESKANFDAYKASPHFKESGEVLFPMMSAQPDSLYFNAEVLQ